MNRNFGKNLRTPAYAAVTAALLAASAWIVIPAAVPFTLQTFVLYVCAGLLPSGVCLRAAAVYILLGLNVLRA